MRTILNHSFTNSPPTGKNIAVGELVLQITDQKAKLYTKDILGNVLPIGEGVQNFSSLLDVDVSTARDGDFIVKQGDKFAASSQIGSISRLSDVEINNPLANQYLRYNPTLEAFTNSFPTYSLHELTDVEVLAPEDVNANAQNNKVLYFDAVVGKWKARPRLNLLDELVDVTITPPTPPRYQILSQLGDGNWINDDLHIVRDTSPALGGNLNANGYYIQNSFFAVGQAIANTPTLNIDYATADYWVITGVPIATQAQCIINPIISVGTNQVAIMMLELRQNTNILLLGGLTNVKYEEGRAIKLSGNGRTDLITIVVENVNGVITTYVTATLLNLALLGQGGTPVDRYPGIGYPTSQFFDVANLYDDFYRGVELLLNWEAQPSKGKLWYADKSDKDVPISITNVTQEDTDLYTFGILNQVAKFVDGTSIVNITPSSSIVLPGDFCLEFFVRFDETTLYENEGITLSHLYFNSINLSVIYGGTLTPTNQDFTLTVTINSNTFVFENANRLYRYQNLRLIHTAIVRVGSTISVYVDGQFLREKTGSYSSTGSITIPSATIAFIAKSDSVRLTKGYSRYTKNFLSPAPRFGLLGGAEDILPKQIYNTYNRQLRAEIFS